jgi:hypothetical protein
MENNLMEETKKVQIIVEKHYKYRKWDICVQGVKAADDSYYVQVALGGHYVVNGFKELRSAVMRLDETLLPVLMEEAKNHIKDGKYDEILDSLDKDAKAQCS